MAVRTSPSRLIIICGLPGAGKTTLGTRLAAELAGVRMCPDEWMADLGMDRWDGASRDRVEALQWRHTRQLLRVGATVVIEWGTWPRATRDRLRTAARELGAGVELHFLDAPSEELLRRVRARDAGLPNGSRTITLADLERWREELEPPTPEELALYDAPGTASPAQREAGCP